MPDAPWMSSMLDQLLDAIESDPRLQARLRRLLAPPIAASPASALVEPPEVEWIGELMPTTLADRKPAPAGRASTTATPPAESATERPAAAPSRPASTALPPVLPPPPVRRKASPANPLAASRPAPEPRRPTPSRQIAVPAPAAAATAPPKPTTPARPKPVAVPAALRAPAPPPQPALLDLPTPVAPFVVHWLAASAPEPEPLAGPMQHPLVDGLRRELGSAATALASRLPADLLQPAGLRPARPGREMAAELSAPASPEGAPRPTTGTAVVARPPLPSPTPTALARPTERQLAAALLAGRVAVMIGGECRPEKQEALRRELGLQELRWLSTRAHASTEPLLTAISDPDVALVLLLIKLSSHSFGDLAEPCKRRGIPLVRVPGGYSANQLAHQILVQAGERLAALSAA